MILLAGCALVLATVPLFGGRFGAMVEIRISGAGLLVAALLLQIAVIDVLPDRVPRELAAVVHLVSLGLGLGFVWVNRRLRGIGLLAAGALCNVAAIAANGGVMPAAPHALEIAGLADDGGGFQNSAVVEQPRLALLGDVFAIPEGWPLANVFSVGDLLLLGGAAVVLHEASRSRLARPVGPVVRPASGAASHGSACAPRTGSGTTASPAALRR